VYGGGNLHAIGKVSSGGRSILVEVVKDAMLMVETDCSQQNGTGDNTKHALLKGGGLVLSYLLFSVVMNVSVYFLRFEGSWRRLLGFEK
jgi:hypothetical protein